MDANAYNKQNEARHNSLIFFVNGKKIIEKFPDPEWTLLFYLRNKLQLCGTKLGCGEGGCGACTVMVSKYNRFKQQISHKAINACLTPVCAMHGASVTTVEGIGSTRSRLHPVQERIARAHGSQCGFCTPGIVMSMYALLRNAPVPSMVDLETAMQGNLCRCTGYRPIIEGYKTFTQEFQTNGVCQLGSECCKNRNGVGDLGKQDGEKLFESNKFTPLDPSQEPIFPPELKLYDDLDKESIQFKGSTVTWFRPSTMKELLTIKKEFNDAKIIVGNTEVGVEVKFKHCVYPVLIYPTQVSELNSEEDIGSGLQIGASTTLSDLEDVLREEISSKPECETRVYTAIVEMLQYFAGKQIRNAASIGGNIMTGSPISDLIPIFIAAECALEVESLERGRRIVHMGEGFFTSYRKNTIKEDEVLVTITLPKTNRNKHFLAFKQAKRRDDDIAIVNAAFSVVLEDNSDIVKEIVIAYGGMAPTVVLAAKTQRMLTGKRWTAEMLESAYATLVDDLPLPPSAPGGAILYRRSLTLSLFFKAFLNISEKLQSAIPSRTPVSAKDKSGAQLFKRDIPKGAQLFEIIQPEKSPGGSIGKPEVHVSALKQATGEALYCDDIPRIQGELYLALVLSTKAHAKLVNINADEALAMPGVCAFFSAKDLTEEQNKIGPIFIDEELFAKNLVTCHGQIIGAVVADNQLNAQRAARTVKVEYEELQPVIISIEDAIMHNSFFEGYPKKIDKGDALQALDASDHVVSGVCRLGGQEHFYLETHAAIAIPNGEDDELEIYCSCQHPTEIQKLAAHILSIPINRIVARTKRLGGGFGGKESRSVVTALPVALAASRLGKPVRCMLDRDEDMAVSGNRHPFLCKYKVAFSGDGKITGCDIQMYINAGCSMDLSCAVMERAMLHFENSYYIPNIRVQGWVCRTNLPSNTAFRGFGGPQAMFAGEHIIRDVARALNKDSIDIARLNLYQEGDVTHYNQILDNCTLLRCWDECLQNSNFTKRRSEIEAFNSQHRWRKRGISAVSTKFGIGFTPHFLNQAGALVHVYCDGSVLLSHGGTEMGQGLHTKMIQVAAQVLNIPMEYIHIAETSTDKVPNTSPTAASVSSDLNGMAVLNACQEILNRLKPYRIRFTDEGWTSWISKAYFDRVSLSSTGFYASPGIEYDFETNTGVPYNYFTYGAAVSEVEIDCLTGDHLVLRTDIVMDLGSSLNPAIDIGQIEGAFMQGYGLFTLEELITSSEGALLSKGPGTYKIPGFADIPVEFNVALLKGAPNPRAVYSSKAVGEPPLFLASSIFFAIKEAIGFAREDAGLDKYFYLESPATAARIRMGCQDHLTNKFALPPTSSFVPWNIVP